MIAGMRLTGAMSRRFGIPRDAAPMQPADVAGNVEAALKLGGVNTPSLRAPALRRQLRDLRAWRPTDPSPRAAEARGSPASTGKVCVSARLFSGHVARGHGSLDYREQRRTGQAVEQKHVTDLRAHGDCRVRRARDTAAAARRRRSPTSRDGPSGSATRLRRVAPSTQRSSWRTRRCRLAVRRNSPGLGCRSARRRGRASSTTIRDQAFAPPAAAFGGNG